MSWDTFAVVAIVLAAGGYVAWRYLFRKSGGCGCGCSGGSGGSGCCGGGRMASGTGGSCGCGK